MISPKIEQEIIGKRFKMPARLGPHLIEVEVEIIWVYSRKNEVTVSSAGCAKEISISSAFRFMGRSEDFTFYVMSGQIS